MAKHILNLEDLKDIKGVNYLHAKDGYYRVEDTPLGSFSAKVKEIPRLPEGKEFFIFKLPKKIPFELIRQCIAFFKQQFNRYHTECMAQIFWDFNKEKYFIYVPKQEANRVNVDCIRNSELEQKHLLVMDIHSHHVMPAKFSAKDDNDEKGTRLYAVVGNLQKELMPDITVRAGTGGNFIYINPYYVIEEPTEKIKKDYFNIKVPENWFEAVSTHKKASPFEVYTKEPSSLELLKFAGVFVGLKDFIETKFKIDFKDFLKDSGPTKDMMLDQYLLTYCHDFKKEVIQELKKYGLEGDLN